MRRHLHPSAPAGVTLIELMIGLAVMAVLVALVGPSFRDMIDMQRLRGASAQFTSDLQFARSEAISRGTRVAVRLVGNVEKTCYIVYTCGQDVSPSACICDCTRPTNKCVGSQTELRSVDLPSDQAVYIAPTVNPQGNTVSAVIFSPINGGMEPWNIGIGGFAALLTGPAWSEVSLLRDPSSPKKLRSMVSQAGRPSVCTPSSALVSGVEVCPPASP